MTPQNSPQSSRGNNLAKPDYPTQQSIQQQAGGSTSDMESRLLALENMIRNQHHNGVEAPPIQLETDIRGLFEVVSAVPTAIPRTVYDQVKIYVNSTTYRLYWYDANAHVWHYVTATA